MWGKVMFVIYWLTEQISVEFIGGSCVVSTRSLEGNEILGRFDEL